MKKLLTTLVLGSLVSTLPLMAANHGNNRQKDTMNIKCLLYSPNLFYGIELGEKPIRDMVDTLVDEVPFYDTASQFNLVVVSARDLGFKTQANILWEQILDSAESKGYSVCPPQVGPELYVLSQNTPKNKELLLQRTARSRPVFIGMDRIRHEIKGQAKGSFLSSLFGRKNYFDYVFCIKSNSKKNMYELGYSATNSTDEEKNYTWNNDDLFIFINGGNRAMHKVEYCKN